MSDVSELPNEASLVIRITIMDLPPELLHAIISNLAHDKRSIRSCSATCRWWRGIALEYLSFRRTSAHNITSIDTVTSFLQGHTKLARTISILNLQGAAEGDTFPGFSFSAYRPLVSLNAEAVAGILKYLPGLTTLSLNQWRYETSTEQTAHATVTRNRRPHLLTELHIGSLWDEGPSVTELLRVVALFKVVHLRICPPSKLVADVPFDPDALQRPLAIKLLDFKCSEHGNPGNVLLLDALAQSLAAGSLNIVVVECDSAETARMLGKLLGRVGSTVTHLYLSASRPRDEWLTVEMGLPLSSSPPDLSNPYADWRSLNISACTRLEVIHIPIYFRPTELGETLSTFAALMLSQAPPTLRTIKIFVYDLTDPSQLQDTTLWLPVFDSVVTKTRFPLLKKFELESHCECPDWQEPSDVYEDCREAAREVLPELDGSGLLLVY